MLKDLIEIYRRRLSNYPFENSEEATEEGIINYRLREKEEYTALETPYTMKQIIKTSTKELPEHKEWEESTSSEAVDDDNSTPFYENITLNVDLFHRGKQIIDNCEFTLIRNEKYGLVGRNGIGKTTLLKAIRKRKFGMPKGVQIHAIKQDYVSDEKVIDFVGADGGRVLQGFGFTKEKQEMTLRELSGGWRMRAQLAKAIHISPDLLLLDEPTNFLDIEGIAYLQEAVKGMKTVMIVSHDRNFLNATTDRTLHMIDMKIEEYRGNYEAFSGQRSARLQSQLKAYEEQVAERAHIQSFIDRFRYSAARAGQAQSRMKMLERMEVLEPPRTEAAIKFSFNSKKIDGTVVELEKVSFSYEGSEREIFKSINFKVKSKSRIVIVGENGEGKSTLLKMIAGKEGVEPKAGKIDSHSGLSVGYFTQHHVDQLEHGEYTLSYLMRSHREDESRRALAAFGLRMGNQRIGTLSGGQKSRMAFALLNLKEPNVMLLDEPTNHLDMETIDALADALVKFEGAVVCVSHDLAFIEKVFDEVYVCGGGELKRFNGTVREYQESRSNFVSL